MTSIHDSTTSIDSRSKTGPGGVPLEDSIKEFREELEKLNIYDPERMDEHFLVRFLKARKFKIPDCVAMLQGILLPLYFNCLCSIRAVARRFQGGRGRQGVCLFRGRGSVQTL